MNGEPGRGQKASADLTSPWLDEHDACAILASVRKTGESTHGNLKRVLDALSKMGHRSGDVNGEGDGCGVLTDIPRRLWAKALEEAGKPAWLAEDRRFFVGHLMISGEQRADLWGIQEHVIGLVNSAGASLLVERPGYTRRTALGRLGREQEPIFWQVAGMMEGGSLDLVESRLFELALRIERSALVHVASLSSYSVVYKVRGTVETLYHYYPDLRSPDYMSAITLGHARYSTNTATAFERVQPFSLLGHNGEINTIAQLRRQAQMIGAQLVDGGSDSQDLDRLLATLIHRYGFSLMEAMEIAFPPVPSEVENLSLEMRRFYQYYRQAWGPFAQGPAAIVARYGDECAVSVDALGLRPLWFGETEKDYFFSSEKGVYHLDALCCDPRPLSPGEKMGVIVGRPSGVEVLDHPAFRRHLLARASAELRPVGVGPEPRSVRARGEDLVLAAGSPALRDRGSAEPGRDGPAESRPAPNASSGARPAPNESSGARPAPNESNGARWQRDPMASVTPRSSGDRETWLAAFGWGREDREWVEALGENGQEPLGSLGFDGPLAALSAERQNIADYLKETVAVVTNPAIDREREMEHFSTQCVIGPRPTLDTKLSEPALSSPWAESVEFNPWANPRQEDLRSTGPLLAAAPLLLGGQARTNHQPLLPDDVEADLAASTGLLRLEDVLAVFSGEVAHIAIVTWPGESTAGALDRLQAAAVEAVRAGAKVVLLDDGEAFSPAGFGWVDPHLAVAAIDRALSLAFRSRRSFSNGGTLAGGVGPRGGAPWGGAAPPPLSALQESLRRQVGIVLRSGAIRNLNDLIISLGLGADAVAPYMLFEVAMADSGRDEVLPEDRAARVARSVKALRIGLEKVTSQMGIHELRGYGRIFAGIGLSRPVAARLGIWNYGGSETRGLTWADLEADAARRAAVVAGTGAAQLARTYRQYPKVWKLAGQVSRGETSVQAYEQRLEELTREQPIALRHVLDFRIPEDRREGGDAVSAAQVDAGLTDHSLPFVISSMSFGSQGETAYRAYAEAAYRLNILCLNGEGGEIRDMMGKYPHNRGQQIASGRFGVDINLINSSNLLEIKVGQGAKPGEGGHLPGRKVSAKVAAARHARAGVDLISPSNNHDIYSIEDLAQFIEELKTANSKARVAVKVPVVPGIGVIAVGIAKAGADIINLSGYDGGTGAARKHAIKHVGLPAEIGVAEAHRALVEAGLRERVEVWCDGGMRSAADVVKMICLGANRVGFGTLAMVAAGCTVCRSCQTDTCHVGIATQIETREEAEAHGLKRFVPLELETATQGLVTLFAALGEEVREITARLGCTATQQLVGRTDLLEQVGYLERLDLTELLAPSMPRARQAGGGMFDASLTDRDQDLLLISRQGGVVETTGSHRALRRPRNHLTTVISNLVMEAALTGEEVISFEDDKVSPVDRALGTHLAGALTRYRQGWTWLPGHGGVGGSLESWRLPVNGANGNGHHVREANLRLYESSTPGNGLGAYITYPVNIIVEGGAQDGVAKGLHGGRVVILKGYNHNGVPVDGSVGKSLAYGAIGGLVLVQGDADSRACIRLSGADVIIGGMIRQPIDDSLGCIGARANVKGFLCEYMTAGRVLVLGDPGPWMCAGMTGGVLYLHLQPQMGLDREAIRRRIARGAQVRLLDATAEDEGSLHFLLTTYAAELARSNQPEEAGQVGGLLRNWQTAFLKVQPAGQVVDQSISAE
jgi:glutamate synthase (NADPH/NADH) large chain